MFGAFYPGQSYFAQGLPFTLAAPNGLPGTAVPTTPYTP